MKVDATRPTGLIGRFPSLSEPFPFLADRGQIFTRPPYRQGEQRNNNAPAISKTTILTGQRPPPRPPPVPVDKTLSVAWVGRELPDATCSQGSGHTRHTEILTIMINRIQCSDFSLSLSTTTALLLAEDRKSKKRRRSGCIWAVYAVPWLFKMRFCTLIFAGKTSDS